MVEQKCSTCGEVKPVADFYIRKETGEYRKNCKRCIIDGKRKIVKITDTKTCKHCGEDKPNCDYHKAGKWLQPYCKICDAIRKAKFHIEHKDIIASKQKCYYEENKEYILAREKQRRASKPKNPPKLIIYKYGCKDYLKTEQFKAVKYLRDKEYREKNQEKIKRNKRAYYNLKGREQSRLWQLNQKDNIEHVTKKKLRGRIYVALKRGVKSEGTMELLGCTIEAFKEYFQSLFTEGMSWDVYLKGGIHIDHKIPCKHFNLAFPAEQKKCFHYTNLQPLWGIDNLKKGAKLNYNICQEV